MANHRKFDHEKVVQMYDAGYSAQKISEEFGGRVDTVKNILRENGRNQQHQREDFKCPISREEIGRYQEALQIGQRVTVKIQSYDENFCQREKEIECTVVEKYRYIFLVQDVCGRRKAIQYIDMLITERG